jgi:trans-aconitate 2-methyltransferase
MTDTWKPDQYERFKAERSRPFYDLLALVEPAAAMQVVDLGCGTGELTADLHRRLQARRTIGIDQSAAMLGRADAHSGGGLTFERGDLFEWSPPFAPDLIFSNAALHWVGDHPALFARLARLLAPAGQLTVQMPMNFDYPSHVVAREIEEEEPFRGKMGGGSRIGVPLTPEQYAVLLDDLGFRRQLVRLQVYAHHLDSRDQVVEWVKGTLLNEYETRLGPELFPLFLERYRARLLPRLRDTRPFFYPFKRLLLWGRC